MKLKGWGTPWEWERSKEVVVFTVDNKANKGKSVVIKDLEGVLKEFSIQIRVIDGNSKYGDNVALVQTLLKNSVKADEIYYDKFEEEIRKARKEGQLPYGLVVLVDKDKYKFYHPSWQKEPAIYGVGISDGVVIMRHTHREAVRHEFGHMLGLRIHHEGCVMDYTCIAPTFCSQCKRQIKEIWQEEIVAGNLVFPS